MGSDLTISAGDPSSQDACQWSSSEPSVLASFGDGRFHAQAVGSAVATAQCTSGNGVSASVRVAAVAPGPISITRGGTYSGTWNSDNPAVPAVSIVTDEPVTLKNSVITGRGDLINISGGVTGANVTVENVTGTANDPGTAGLARGAFLTAQKISSLHVEHCTMTGPSYGIRVLSSTLNALSLTKNVGRELDDRASDGHGGLESNRPSLGHFIYLYNVSAPSGAEIAWNQMINTVGSSSTEDVINLFKSQGTVAAPIRVHDNYMEGYSSTTTASYTGVGLLADGDSSAPVTAYVNFEANEMVHTAGSGLEIAAGHDIRAHGNRVVSCGMDPQGKWFAMPFVNGVILWNFYGAPDFYNNIVEGTSGGVLKPDPDGKPTTGDLYARTEDLDSTDRYKNENFTDPCLVNGQVDLGAEDAERAYWASKFASSHITLGDQHQP